MDAPDPHARRDGGGFRAWLGTPPGQMRFGTLANMGRMAALGACIALGMALGYKLGINIAGLIAIIALFLLSGIGVAALVRGEAAHHALERQRMVLLDMLEDAGDPRLVSDGDGAAVYANSHFRALAPAGAEGAAAIAALLTAAPGGAAALAQLEGAIARGRAAGAELTLEGGRRYEIAAHPIKGWPGYVHWRLRDVTEQRATEELVAAERAKLNDFMDNAPVGFFSVDAAGRFLFVNKVLADWLGHDAAEMTAGRLKLGDILAEPPGGRPIDLFEAGGDEQQGEIWLKARDGARFHGFVTQSLVRDADGTVERGRAVIRDLGPERAWEAALHASEQRFQRFVKDAPIGIALLDRSGTLIECNPAMLRMLGGDARKEIGRALGELVAEPDRDRVIARLFAVMAGEDMTQPAEARLKSAGGEVIVHLYARRFQPSGGQPEGLILYFIDLSEQKKLEIQFVQSQKMQAVGQLAGGVAHDFNNLLTAMIGFCDLLLLRHRPGDPSFADIMQIKQNANRAANLVRQLLAFSRQQTLQPRVLDITDVLAELTHLIRRLIGENIELKVVHARELGLVKVDQGQLEQVLINLAVNARDAMKAGGELTIATEKLVLTAPRQIGGEDLPAGEWVVARVTDTGSGIAPEIMGRIFDPFFTTKQIGTGTGLGLSTVYGIIRQTGGFVFVESELGRGTTFAIYLPAHREAARDIAPARPAEDKASDLTGKGRILLVEDEDAVRVFGARALRNKGYEVLEAADGQAALELLAAHHGAIDLLITDVVMPNIDGPTLVTRVRADQPHLKVIFISGYTEDRFKDSFGEDDSVDFLPKPFSLKQLAAKVKETIREVE